MRTDSKFSSNGFEIVNDPDCVVSFEDDLDELCIDEAHLVCEDRRLAMWQQIERHLGERQHCADFDELDYWHGYLTAH